jgi:hypothetical protein
MIPHERSLVKKLEGKPFVLLGVNSDRDKEMIATNLKKHQVTWRSFWCGEDGTGGTIPAEWNVSGWPTLYLIDHQGVIQKKWIGSPDTEEEKKAFDDEVEKHVKIAEAAAKQG